MKWRSSIHNHCTICDGKSQAEEMIQAAIDAGIRDFGFSCHGYAPFDPEYSVPGQREYIDEIGRLKQKYAGRLRIYCGIEDDYYSDCSENGYDYKIASVHYIYDKERSHHYYIDATPEDLEICSRDCFHGDGLALAESYYRILTEHVLSSRPQVVGHFDVLMKCNDICHVIDENSGRYLDAAFTALDACAAIDPIFEVNTGAMFRGLKKHPYPADYLLKRLAHLNGRIVLTTDCHDAAGINFGIKEAGECARNAGFNTMWALMDGEFHEIPL